MLSVQTPLTAAALAVVGILMAGLGYMSAGGYGVRLYRHLWPGNDSILDEAVFAPALGYGIIGLLMVAAGLLHAWTRTGAWLILCGGLGFCLPFIRKLGSAAPATPSWPKLSLVLVLLCALWGLLLALAPVTYYDSLVYHFAMPAAYVKARQWVGLKELIYSAFPQNLEMLWTFGILLWRDTVSNLTSFVLAGMTVGATIAFANRSLNAREGRIAVVLLITMPAFLLLSSGGYVDIGVTLYSFLSLYAFCAWTESESESGSILILSGLFAGLAMGTKYTAGISFVAVALLILWQLRHQPAVALKSALRYGISAVLPLSPWLVKNLLYVGNPVFPFFYSWGNPRLSPWVQGAAAGYFHGIAEYEPRTLGNLLRLPWDIAVHSLRFGTGMDVLGDYGWAPFMILIPFLLLSRGRPRLLSVLLAYAALFVFPWAMTRPVLRFLLPLAPVLALASAVAWTECIGQWPVAPRAIAKGCLAALFLTEFVYFFNVISVIQPFPVALGLESREAYLSRKISYYSAADFVSRLPNARGVFVFGDQRGYYYRNALEVSPIFNLNPLVSWANAADGPEALAAALKERGLTHVVINHAEIRRLAPYHAFEFSPQGERNWGELQAHFSRRIYRDKACEVLEL